jgi:hypothetical protein
MAFIYKIWHRTNIILILKVKHWPDRVKSRERAKIIKSKIKKEHYIYAFSEFLSKNSNVEFSSEN